MTPAVFVAAPDAIGVIVAIHAKRRIDEIEGYPRGGKKNAALFDLDGELLPPAEFFDYPYASCT